MRMRASVLLGLVLASSVAAGAPGALAGRARPPSLEPIRAFFVPPDETKAPALQCQTEIPVSPDDPIRRGFRGLSFFRCATYYFVTVPDEVGAVGELEILWRLRGKPECGWLTLLHEDKFRKRAKPVESEAGALSLVRWRHPHHDQRGDNTAVIDATFCEDDYPHAGRTMSVRVTSPDWECTAKYPDGATGTQFPDTSGLVGNEPKPCSRHTDKEK